MYIDKNRLPWTCSSVTIIVVLGLIFFFEYYAFIFVFTKKLTSISVELAIFIFSEMHFFIALMGVSYYKVATIGPGYLTQAINEQFPNAEQIKAKQKQFLKIKFSRNRAFGTADDSVNDKVDDPEANINVEKLQRLVEDPILQLPELGYCLKCELVKLPRTHHCRQCNRCVLRMDHHCPWIGNCVGFYNHKYFALFLGYAACCLLQVFFWEFIYYFLDTQHYTQKLEMSEKSLIQINSMSSLALGLAVTFLFGLHIHMARNNVTTVEFHLKDIIQRNPFNKGTSKNVEEVFGIDRSSWLLPMTPRLRKEDELFLLQELE